jgi:hypothetical protein
MCFARLSTNDAGVLGRIIRYQGDVTHRLFECLAYPFDVIVWQPLSWLPGPSLAIEAVPSDLIFPAGRDLSAPPHVIPVAMPAFHVPASHPDCFASVNSVPMPTRPEMLPV